jgi:hypothetical protein
MATKFKDASPSVKPPAIVDTNVICLEDSPGRTDNHNQPQGPVQPAPSSLRNVVVLGDALKILPDVPGGSR